MFETRTNGDKAWRMADAPADYMATMIDNIVSFDLEVTRIVAKTKASQNREPRDFDQVVDRLSEGGHASLSRRMNTIRETRNDDFANLPEPPYYIVAFSSTRTPGDDGYGDMADRMVRLAAEQDGFLGIESARSPMASASPIPIGATKRPSGTGSAMSIISPRRRPGGNAGTAIIDCASLASNGPMVTTATDRPVPLRFRQGRKTTPVRDRPDRAPTSGLQQALDRRRRKPHADAPRRNSGHDRVVRYGAGHHGTGGDDGTGTDLAPRRTVAFVPIQTSWPMMTGGRP